MTRPAGLRPRARPLHARTSPSGAPRAARLGSPVLDLGARDRPRRHPAGARRRTRCGRSTGRPAMLAELGAAPGGGAARGRRRGCRPVAGDLRAFAPRPGASALVLMRDEHAPGPDRPRRPARLPARGRASTSPPGGELIFDVALPDVEEIVATMGVERPGGLHRDPASGATLVHSAWYDAGTRPPRRWSSRCASERRDDAAAPPSTVLRRHRVHLFSPEEIGDAARRGRARADRGARRLRRRAGRSPAPSARSTAAGPPRERRCACATSIPAR